MSAREHRGALVPAATVARALGLDTRTVKRWIQTGRIAGGYVAPGLDGCRGRWYVHRGAFENLRDAKTPPST